MNGPSPRESRAGELVPDLLQELLLDSPDINEFLAEFTELLHRNLSRMGLRTWCTIILLREHRPISVAASEARAKILGEMHYPPSEGPCLQAARARTVTYVPDTGGDSRWPTYTRALAQRGVKSLLAVPLDLDGEAKGSFNVYAAHPDAFDETTRQGIRDQVALAAPALRLAVRLTHYRETEEHLSAAMRSRTAINLAVGIVMGQNRCSQDEAFRILAAAASNRNVKLRKLAEDLVARTGEGPATTHFDR